MATQARCPATHVRVRAERALRAAADELEGGVQRRQRLARASWNAAPRQTRQAAEGDDERGDADVGDEEALEGTRSPPRATMPNADAR